MNPAPPGPILVEILALAPGIPRTELLKAGTSQPQDAQVVLRQLFGERIGPALAPRPLREACVPVAGRIYAGSYGNTTLVCGAELLELVDLGPIAAALSHGRLTFRLQIDSTIPSTALLIADADGDPVREVMLLEGQKPVFDEGPHLSFEAPFWRTQHGPAGVRPSSTNGGAPITAPRFPDPVQFGLAALHELFGVALTDDRFGDLPADAVVLAGYALAPDIGRPDLFAAADRPDPGGLPGGLLADRGRSSAGPRGSALPWETSASRAEPGERGDDDSAPALDVAPKRRSWLGRLWDRLFPRG